MAGVLTVGVPREVKDSEHRVAITPDGVRELRRHGVDVLVQAGAGVDSSIADAEYARRRRQGRATTPPRCGAAPASCAR